MGFFSELLGAALPIAGAVIGGPVGGGAGTALANLLGAGDPDPVAVTKVGLGKPLTIAGIERDLASGALTLPGVTATAGLVTGRLRKRTIVQTFDPATGKVVKMTTFAGGVAVRAADVAAAKRVFRQVRKLSAKMPRKLVKESPVKQLTDRVVKNALERAGDDPSCPK